MLFFDFNFDLLIIVQKLRQFNLKAPMDFLGILLSRAEVSKLFIDGKLEFRGTKST